MLTLLIKVTFSMLRGKTAKEKLHVVLDFKMVVATSTYFPLGSLTTVCGKNRCLLDNIMKSKNHRL